MLELFRSKRRAFVWLVDALLIVAMLLVAAGLRLGLVDAEDRFAVLVGKMLVAAAIVQASLYYHGLYADELVASARRLFFDFARALAAGVAATWLVFYVVRPLELGRGVLGPGIAFAALVLPVWRLAYEHFRRRPTFTRHAVILGDGALALDLYEIIQNRPLGLTCIGMLRRPGSTEPAAPGVVGTYDDLLTLTIRHRIDLVLVACRDRRGALPVEQLLTLKFNGIQVEEGVDFYEEVTGKLYVRELQPSHLIFSEGFQTKRSARRLKRIFDIVVALVGLVLAAPIMALTAILIKIDSAGPILYRQTRVGEFGREFSMLKFRSMRADAEKDGARWASEHDDRVTRVGRFIRKARIDELPQLWNVLRGDMSIVGPRPERPVFVVELEKQVPYFRQRLCVKPGVTGHAQVRCRYAASIEDSVEKLQYDLYYIKSFSLLFDLSILFDTIKVVLRKIGAR